MNKKIIIANIALVLLLPLMFIDPREDQSLTIYLMRSIVPLLMCMVFFINYYKLIPRVMLKPGRHSLLMPNTIIISLCCVALTGWHKVEFEKINEIRSQNELLHQKSDKGKAQPKFETTKKYEVEFRKKSHMKSRRFWVAAVFDGLNLIFAAFVAYSIRSSEHINNLEKQQKEAEVARQKAELKGLRNQISPHFLLNTLNNIYALAAISTERTQSAVMQLSKLLRHMLYDNQSEMVTLRSEAEFISSYIDLMKLRLTNNVRIESNINIPPDSQTMVAPLLYISLVENAFKHGVASTKPCIINISLHEDAEHIICDIINSNHPKTSADRSGHGIGLQLVKQRLESVYSERYEWTNGVEDDMLYHSKITIKKHHS